MESKDTKNKASNPPPAAADEAVTFKDLGVNDILCASCKRVKWTKPSPIQQQAIPEALKGKDIIGLAQTGSGKTGAFALPILQAWLEQPSTFFALVLAPTRELAYQISEQFEGLGAANGIRTAVLVGGMDIDDQKKMLMVDSKKRQPHIIVATPGRLLDHMMKTKGFSLKHSLKYLVMDEADRLLTKEFEREVNMILEHIPRQRRTFLFSATMTKNVEKLQRTSLRDPVVVEVCNKYTTVDTLDQRMNLVAQKYKDLYLIALLVAFKDKSIIVFCNQCKKTDLLARWIRYFDFKALPLSGHMTQEKRLGSLNAFRSGSAKILVATDVAARGLDIPSVELVINYDVPMNKKDYIHRVGRTARQDRGGMAITLISQYHALLMVNLLIEVVKKDLPKYPITKEDVLPYADSVAKAQKMAADEIQAIEDKKFAKKNARKRGSEQAFSGGCKNKPLKKKQKRH